MSLVNDLLVEIDRRRDETGPEASSPFDGLSPRRVAPRRRAFALAPLGLLACSVLLVSGAAYLGFSNRTLVPLSAIAKSDPPSVSARPTESLPIHVGGLATSSPILPADDQVIERPTEIHSIGISNDSLTTRVRVVADESTLYRIETSEDGRQIELVFESATMRFQTRELQLMGTPIRAIQTHRTGPDLLFSLALDAPVRVQSQWMKQGDGAVLLIDLQHSAAITQARTSWPNERQAIDTQFESDRREAVLPILETEDEDVDLRIARSDGDRMRLVQNELYERAREDFEAARFARAEGDLATAQSLYESALETLPGYRDATLELVTLLSEMSRPGDAAELIRAARRESPRDEGMAMLHARLLAQTGDIESAVELLDRSGFNLTQSPNIHSLAAALLQQAGLHEEAIERYESVLRRYPGESRWWMGLGISLEARNRKVEAIDAYRIAIRLGELPGQTRQWVSARVDILGEEG